MIDSKDIEISDDELNRLLDELGFHAREEKKKTLFHETFKYTQNATPKEQEPQKTSLKSSLFVTSILLLFTLVQASFILPLFKSAKKIEKAIERLELKIEELTAQPLYPPLAPPELIEPEGEIITPTLPLNDIYNKA
jgi:hypothetical protein